MAVVVPVLLVAGCGGDDSTTVESTTDVTATTSSTTASVPAPSPASTASTITTPSTVTTIEASPNTEPMVSSSAAPVETGLELRPDGLGVVAFGASRTETLAALGAVLGEPSNVSEPFQDSATTMRASASWPALDLTFQGAVDGEVTFSAYEFGRRFGVDANGNPTEDDPWQPVAWQVATAAADGVAPGTAVADVLQRYPTVYATDCGRGVVAAELAHGAGMIGDQLFLEPIESGLFVRLATDGTVFSVGAQQGPNPYICDGAG